MADAGLAVPPALEATAFQPRLFPCSELSRHGGTRERLSPHLKIPAQPAGGCSLGPFPLGSPALGPFCLQSSPSGRRTGSLHPHLGAALQCTGSPSCSWSPYPSHLLGATAGTEWTQKRVKSGSWPLEGRGRSWGCWERGVLPPGVPSCRDFCSPWARGLEIRWQPGPLPPPLLDQAASSRRTIIIVLGPTGPHCPSVSWLRPPPA